MKTGSKVCVVLSLAAFAALAGGCSSKKVSWADGAHDGVSGSSAAPGNVSPHTATSTTPPTASDPTGAATIETASGPSSDDTPGLGTNVREFAQSINVSRVSFAEEGADFDPSVS